MIRTQNARDKKRMKMDDMEVTIKQLQQQNKILAKQVTIPFNLFIRFCFSGQGSITEGEGSVQMTSLY